MADVSDVQRQAVLCTRDMRITTRANIGTPDFDGGWQLALWQIGDLMMESLPLTGVHSAGSTCRQSTHIFQGRTFTGAALRRRYPCQPRGRRAAPK